jgi:PleD family two-component response regulator
VVPSRKSVGAWLRDRLRSRLLLRSGVKMTDDQHSSSQKRPRVLIIESDFLIAEMIQDMVDDLGYIVSRTVHHLPSALEELKKENFDTVLVNVGIDQEKHGTEIAEILADMGVPFAS